jgi:azurin
MFSKVRTVLAGAAVVSALVLTACGGTNGGSGGVAVDSTPGIAYEETAITLPAAGGPVTFNNKSTGLQHNWVLVRGGDDVAAQVDAAGSADPSDYVPDGDPNVVVATKLLNGGQNETVTVPALPAGQYLYICTYPGHYTAGMKGTLTVE